MVKKSRLTKEYFDETGFISGQNATYVEQLYECFLETPELLPEEWQQYFTALFDNASVSSEISHAAVREQFLSLAKESGKNRVLVQASGEQSAVDALIAAYRRFGHLHAQYNPLQNKKATEKRLSLAYHALDRVDKTTVFLTRGLLPVEKASLSEIVAALATLYCGSIGLEYKHIENEAEVSWLSQAFEQQGQKETLEVGVQRNLLKQLVAAEGLERYLDSRYPGQKRFSLEGVDALIPMLRTLTEQVSETYATQQVVVGMAHRGRLNVLINVMGQPAEALFRSFDNVVECDVTSGDVKYHRGYANNIKTKKGAVHLSLAFNPSHLEFINTVVLGSVRARQKNNATQKGNELDYALPVLIHGDAAFAGQGIVMETLSLSQPPAYHVGGAVHIILNNQIGFTTSNPQDARSSRYCSDLAKMIDAPVWHVNADDPEAAISAMQCAIDYRMCFHKDVIIDLVGYRRHGHQEVDEPRATQPLMYNFIGKHPRVVAQYAEKLIARGVCTSEEVASWREAYRDTLDKGEALLEIAPQEALERDYTRWDNFIDKEWREPYVAQVACEKLKHLAQQLVTFPEHFTLQRNVQMIMSARKKMAEGLQPLDWGYAENLAYASLLEAGVPIRFSGEDSRRGTFFHRQATLFDQATGESYTALEHVSDKTDALQLYDSVLSETGVLGFEYGYATADPNSLVVWEAQFGDFANVAQVIIDQFISSGWQKWRRLSGLVMLLPHGYEGMGPEHSSARLERYLQLCAQNNIQVFCPTTPAQIFHLLRRQAIRAYRRPLIVMTPKSLLRHKLVTSSFEELASGELALLLPEIDPIESTAVSRVIVCSGKVYYDLLEKRRAQKIQDVAILRVEQLYPFPDTELTAALAQYPAAREFVWCQEEPQNQGAWFSTRHRLDRCAPEGFVFEYVGRPFMAAPAGGYPALHSRQQADLVNVALNLKEETV